MKAHHNGKRSRSVILCGGRQKRLPQGARFVTGFSLVELLVVIGIIVILAGILIPTISGIRKAGMRTKSASIVSNLSSAIQRYQQEFGAYPGPIANNNVYGIPGIANTLPTMSENLVLALSGGLKVDSAAGVTPAVVNYYGDLVGTGPKNLNPAAGKINRQYPPFVDGVPMSPIGVQFSDEGGTANDTVIPEYLDGYGDPLPIIYLRATTGARATVALGSQQSFNNEVCTDYDPSMPGSILGQYDLSQLRPYTDTFIGAGRDTSKQSKYRNSAAFPAHGLRSVQTNLQYTLDETDPNYAYPYDAYALLGSPQYKNGTRFTQPRQRDGFILIAAGPDRIYGTEDDIYSFGSLD